MTRLTLGAKCSGWTTPFDWNFGAALRLGNIDDNANAPRPVRERDKKVRRLASRWRSSNVFMVDHSRRDNGGHSRSSIPISRILSYCQAGRSKGNRNPSADSWSTVVMIYARILHS